MPLFNQDIPKNCESIHRIIERKTIFVTTQSLRMMKKLILSALAFLLPLAASAQSEVQTDTIHGFSMDNYKVYDDGFILDMGMQIATPKHLMPPQLTYDFHSRGEAKDYYKLFQLNPDITYGKENLTIFSRGYSGYGMHGLGAYGFGTMPPTLQSATFKLKNGWKITTFGEYDADGNKVRNPSALPWERNNFNGAFEMKSENGNFGIRIEVQRGRTVPY